MIADVDSDLVSSWLFRSARVFRRAEAVVGERFDDAAITDTLVPTLVDHARQLEFQRLQAGNAPLDFREVIAGDAICLVARRLRLSRQREQFANIVDLEAEFARMADEVQPVDFRGPISPLAALGARRRRQ